MHSLRKNNSFPVLLFTRTSPSPHLVGALVCPFAGLHGMLTGANPPTLLCRPHPWASATSEQSSRLLAGIPHGVHGAQSGPQWLAGTLSRRELHSPAGRRPRCALWHHSRCAPSRASPRLLAEFWSPLHYATEEGRSEAARPAVARQVKALPARMDEPFEVYLQRTYGIDRGTTPDSYATTSVRRRRRRRHRRSLSSPWPCRWARRRRPTLAIARPRRSPRARQGVRRRGRRPRAPACHPLPS